MENSLSKQFIVIYNELDAYLRNFLGLSGQKNISHVSLLRELEKKRGNFPYTDDLISYADLRNAIIHNPFAKTVETIAEPHKDVVENYRRIVDYIKNPPKALSIAVPAQKIYKTEPNANAIDVMTRMEEKIYTHVPVLHNNNLVGIFSETTILSYLVKHKEGIIDKETKIKDFGDLLEITNHSSEIFLFIPRDTLIEDIQALFTREIKNGKRLAVIFLTATGKREEAILGMITAWDLPKIENK